jgi:hypothetical protein
MRLNPMIGGRRNDHSVTRLGFDPLAADDEGRGSPDDLEYLIAPQVHVLRNSVTRREAEHVHTCARRLEYDDAEEIFRSRESFGWEVEHTVNGWSSSSALPSDTNLPGH